MRTLYIDCGMGAAGDMLMGALLELIPDRESFLKEMNALGLPGVQVRAEKAVKCGVTGTHMRVIIDGREGMQLVFIILVITETDQTFVLASIVP